MKTTVELIHGLPHKELVEKIFFHHRQGEVSDRALGFYLLDMERRKEFLPYLDAAHWAVKHLECARPDKLILLARYLEDLPEIAKAFSEGEVPWTKIRAVSSPLDPPKGTLPGSPTPTPSGSGSTSPGG